MLQPIRLRTGASALGQPPVGAPDDPVELVREPRRAAVRPERPRCPRRRRARRRRRTPSRTAPASLGGLGVVVEEDDDGGSTVSATPVLRAPPRPRSGCSPPPARVSPPASRRAAARAARRCGRPRRRSRRRRILQLDGAHRGEHFVPALLRVGAHDDGGVRRRDPARTSLRDRHGGREAAQSGLRKTSRMLTHRRSPAAGTAERARPLRGRRGRAPRRRARSPPRRTRAASPGAERD